MPVRLTILDPLTEAGLRRFAEHLPPDFTLSTARSRDPVDQIDAMRHADAVITADVPVTAEMIAAGAAEGLRAIHKWGVGYDNIDIDAARAAGVRVLRTTGSNAVAVAETTLGLILALQRNIVAGHVGVQNGQWLKGPLGARSMLLTGKTVGLIGFGFIGQQLARLLRGFQCTVLYTKRTPLPALEERDLGARFATFDALIDAADIVSLHCALTPQTRGLIDAGVLARMKPGAILVNTARGGLVNEQDLAQALAIGSLRGAAVDVYAAEPIASDHRLIGTEGAILTPHISAVSADTYPATVQRMLHNLRCIAQGREPPAGDVLV
ncbi:dehydrogenase [Gluconacetobacter liquefaciens]|uniref:3-phosphoglycerate dehydrogenase n=1 Tax=Gluconacetobacter liquefaciens TaxID=89584 RepID=A0A370FZ94_GLULI|nr:2-hydroxyacid dehydrogenase [Gluconacetobacter liquefaciens]MBB2187273.1 3-phosphoglycerate dehydrogenase [Gluconacetobacter liquefaciens]RDI36818.1 glyoxylate reductase/glycerate dehydrogenase/D-3-phosphoglycerate dehydrogenase [Gluconacetobacter liquefaciens]GBR05767.1 NAD-binding D-isomer specific 2-hydroxyacid dehydrogenase [Gluconacetobacter liquefaciens NRIC 0522]GEB38857.1 dehydrogenase [Gluconacetobacter liquefaciens]